MVIVKAAIMFSNGEILEGYNYGNIMATARKLSYASADCIHGYMTSEGDFVLPYQAASIAVHAQQTAQLHKDFSPEHLWPQWADK